MSIQMQQRRGTAAQWAAADPILADGEFGLETDVVPYRFKVGDGVTAWSALAYYAAPAGSAWPETISDLGSLSGTYALAWSATARVRRIAVTGSLTVTEGAGWPATGLAECIVGWLNPLGYAITWTLVDEWIGPPPQGSAYVYLRCWGGRITAQALPAVIEAGGGDVTGSLICRHDVQVSGAVGLGGTWTSVVGGVTVPVVLTGGTSVTVAAKGMIVPGTDGGFSLAWASVPAELQAALTSVALTVCAWVKYSATSYGQVFATSVNGSNNTIMGPFLNAIRDFSVTDAAMTYRSIIVSPNVWHHLAIAYDASGAFVAFLDGVQVPDSLFATKTFGSGVIPNPTAYVSGRQIGGNGYVGASNDLRVYARALAAAEIAAIHAATRSYYGV